MSFAQRQRQFKGRYRGGYSRARGVGARKAAGIRARRGAALGRFRAGFDRTGGFYGRYANGGELKFHDVDLDDAAIAQAGTLTASINLIPQGVTEKTRVGRKCVIKSILWRYTIDKATTTSTASGGEIVRVVMFVDKQCNGATAAVAGAGGILETDDYQSYNNLANSGRFRILYDKVHMANSTAAAGDGTANDTFSRFITGKFYKKCNIPLEFDSTTGAITEIRSNNIGVLLLSKTGAITGFDSKIRLRFSDGN